MESAVPRDKFQYQFFVQCFKGLSRDAGSENLALDEQSLELEFQAAIEAENYVRAAELRDELQLLHEDNRAGVLAANAKFYKAFEKGDISAMRMIWSKGG